MKRCTNCGGLIEDDDLFCLSCGEPCGNLPGKETVKVPVPAGNTSAGRTCPVCGGILEPNDLFCATCGTSCGGPQSGGKNIPTGGFSNKRICSVCGSPLDKDSRFCLNCGAPCGDNQDGNFQKPKHPGKPKKPGTPKESGEQRPPKKSDRRKIVIAVGASLIGMVLVGAVILKLVNKQRSDLSWAEQYVSYLEENPTIDLSKVPVVNDSFKRSYKDIEDSGKFLPEYYGLTDIDADGEPELLTVWDRSEEKYLPGEVEEYYIMLLSDIKRGKVVSKAVMLMENNDWIVEVNRNCLVFACNDYDHEDYCIWFVTPSGGKKGFADLRIEDIPGSEGERYRCLIDGDSVTEARFLDALNIGSSAEIREPDFYDVSSCSPAAMEREWAAFTSNVDEIYSRSEFLEGILDYLIGWAYAVAAPAAEAPVEPVPEVSEDPAAPVSPAVISPNSTPTGQRTTPFYGVWGFAADVNKKSAADAVAATLVSMGYPDAQAFLNTDWEILNQRRIDAGKAQHYVVTAGIYETEAEAKAVCDALNKNSYYRGLYPDEGNMNVIYTGAYIGSGSSGSGGSGGGTAKTDYPGFEGVDVSKANWLSEYQYKYVKTSGHQSAYLRKAPTNDTSGAKLVMEQERVTVYATSGSGENMYSLCKTDDGRAGWVLSKWLVNTYVYDYDRKLDVNSAVNSSINNQKDIMYGEWGDKSGNTYKDALRFWVIDSAGYTNSEFIEYSVPAGFTKVAGSLCAAKKSDDACEMYVQIFLDGKLVYSSEAITATSGVESFSVNVSQGQRLKIECSTYVPYEGFCIVDAALKP